MSGSATPPIINLTGTSMSALALAIPAISERTGRAVTVIGGLAVICRLSRPYRATSDLDTVTRRRSDEPAQLELLVASGATRNGVAGVLISTAAGAVQVDILEVTDADLAPLPTDPTDRLHVLSHAWAAASATPVVLRTELSPDLTVAVAEPGPLVAMKLQSIMNERGVDGGIRRGRQLLGDLQARGGDELVDEATVPAPDPGRPGSRRRRWGRRRGPAGVAAGASRAGPPAGELVGAPGAASS